MSLNLGTIVYNRSTGIWQQIVKVTKISTDTLGDVAYVLNTLPAAGP